MRRLASLIAALSVGLALAACGGGSGANATKAAVHKGVAGSDAKGDQAASPDAGSGTAGSAGNAATPAASAGAPKAGTGSSSANPGAAPSAGGGQASGANPAPSASPTPPADQVDGAPVTRTPDDPTPQGCSMQRGSKCQVSIRGTYTLTTAEVANIRIAAYEDGSQQPASSTTLPNAKRGHSGWYVDHFLYVVSAKAKQVTFQVTLLSPTGQVLAQGRANVVPIA